MQGKVHISYIRFPLLYTIYGQAACDCNKGGQAIMGRGGRRGPLGVGGGPGKVCGLELS